MTMTTAVCVSCASQVVSKSKEDGTVALPCAHESHVLCSLCAASSPRTFSPVPLHARADDGRARCQG